MEAAKQDERRRSDSQHRSTAERLAGNRRWMAALVGIAGVLISLLAWRMLLARDRQLVRTRFSLEAEQRVGAIQRELTASLGSLRALTAFYDGSQLVERDEFHVFTKSLFERYRGIGALAWSPLVQAAQRGDHGQSLPVHFLEPEGAKLLTPGLDLLAEPGLPGPIGKSRATGDFAASGPVNDATSSRTAALLVFAPVYAKQQATDDGARQPQTFAGVYVALLDVGTIVEDALSYFGQEGMDLYLFDPSLADEDKLVLAIASPARPGPLTPLQEPPENQEAAMDYSGRLQVADRAWVACCVPTSQYLSAVRPWGAVTGLTVGLLATGLLTVYLILLAEEATRRESLVAERTSQLLDSEQRFRQAINNVFQQALGCETSEEVAEEALAVAERLTESEFGFVGELNPAGRFDTIALSDPGWEACRMPRSDATRMLQGMEIRSIWQAVIESGESVIVNDPPSWPRHVGTPGGYPSLNCFLGVPLKRGGETFGMMCLGNKRPGYGAADQHAVETLSVSLVAALMRKRAEEALRQAHDELETRVEERTAELARSNAELEQFAYAASHDLQEPLRMIASYVGLLGNRYRGRLDKDADDFIEFAVDGAKRMQELIEDLLAYSRVGTRATAFERTDCNRVVDEVVQNLRVLITEEAALVTRDELPVIDADHAQLVQLIQNLVGNAIKFRSEEPPCVHVAGEKRGTECLFSVEDNGVGIDPKYEDRVFAIFQRLHTRREYPGTGIGLAICRRIVERHGGRIWFESKPGNGTTFRFTLSGHKDT